MASSKKGPICAACSKPYTNATMLDCVHSFCRNCVISLIEKSNVEKIFCSTCDTPSKVPDNGVDGFARNIHLDNQVKVASIRLKEDIECQRCRRKGDRKAVEFCFQCNRLLCKTCADDHDVIAEYDGHKRITIEDFKNEEVAMELPIGKCTRHNDKKMEWYCGGHKKLLCKMGKNDDHKECFAQVYSLQAAAEMEKEDLGKYTPQLEKNSEELDKIAAVNKDMMEKVKESQADAIKKIEESYDHLKDALDKCKKYLLNECDKIAEEKEKALTDQLSEVKKLKESYDFLQEQIHDATNKQSLQELLSVKEVMKKRAQFILEDFRVTNWLLKENEAFDLSCNEFDTIACNISSLGFFSEVPDPANCIVEGLSLSDAFVNVNREFKVTFRNERQFMIKEKAMFQYKIEVEEGALEPELQITPTNGMTTLAIKPRSLGQLTLTIMVRNIPLKKFPFVLKVRQPRYFNILPAPKPLNLQSVANCIAINGDQLYVASQNCIEVITTDGTPVETHNELDLNIPFGMTVIENEVYVVNKQTQNVHVFEAGKLVHSFEQHGYGNQFKNPCGICSDGYDRILVADYGHKRVQVFKRIKDGNAIKEEFLFSIPCSSNPVDVAVDASGKVYVALQSVTQPQVPLANPPEQPLVGNQISLQQYLVNPPVYHVEVYTISCNGYGFQSNRNDQRNLGVQPCGIFVDIAGNRFITDDKGIVHIYDPTWRQISTTRQGSYCGGIVLNSNGTIYLNVTNKAQIHKI